MAAGCELQVGSEKCDVLARTRCRGCLRAMCDFHRAERSPEDCVLCWQQTSAQVQARFDKRDSSEEADIMRLLSLAQRVPRERRDLMVATWHLEWYSSWRGRRQREVSSSSPAGCFIGQFGWWGSISGDTSSSGYRQETGSLGYRPADVFVLSDGTLRTGYRRGDKLFPHTESLAAQDHGKRTLSPFEVPSVIKTLEQLLP